MDQPHVEIYVACSFDMNTNVMPLSRHKHRADAGFTGGHLHRTVISSCCKALCSPYRPVSRIKSDIRRPLAASRFRIARPNWAFRGFGAKEDRT